MNVLLMWCVLVWLGSARSWDYKTHEERLRGCVNLTLVLDNWRYAIITQVKELLLNDHSSVLPDYARIEPLSEAVNELYKDFDSLKVRLAELTGLFEGIEMFVEDIRSGRSPSRVGPGTRHARRKVLVRRVKKPDHSKT